MQATLPTVLGAAASNEFHVLSYGLLQFKNQYGAIFSARTCGEGPVSAAWLSGFGCITWASCNLLHMTSCGVVYVSSTTHRVHDHA